MEQKEKKWDDFYKTWIGFIDSFFAVLKESVLKKDKQKFDELVSKTGSFQDKKNELAKEISSNPLIQKYFKESARVRQIEVYQRQYNTAQKLFEIAEKATMLGRKAVPGDRKADYKDFAAWEWDVFCLFTETERKVKVKGKAVQ